MAVLKLLRACFRATSVFAGASWGPELPIAFWDTRGGSDARTPEDTAGSNAGALTRSTRFRLRYSRIQAALCAGLR